MVECAAYHDMYEMNSWQNVVQINTINCVTLQHG